jgi:hypothetical protein
VVWRGCMEQCGCGATVLAGDPAMEKASDVVFLGGEKPCNGDGHGQPPIICVPSLEDDGESSLLRSCSGRWRGKES